MKAPPPQPTTTTTTNYYYNNHKHNFTRNDNNNNNNNNTPTRFPTHLAEEDNRVLVGGSNPEVQHPYSAAILNVSAMSYGALSGNAVLALSTGAAKGGFFHNTGEGGVSRFHLQGGADIVWNVGTGCVRRRMP